MDRLGRPNGRRLADLVRLHRDVILEAWKQRVVALSPARQLPVPVLTDPVPGLLAYLAEAMGAADAEGPAARKLRGVPGAHALGRLGHGYDLADVVNEYAALRAVLLELWEREGGGHAARELIRLNGAIDEAIADAATHYQAARARLLQTLDVISTAALGSSDLDTFLKALLRATRDAAAAVDVAIVLLAAGDALEVHATAGLDDQPLHGVTLEAVREFARVIMELRGPCSLDAALRLLPVTAREIRSRGLRAVHGVPLMHEGRPIGVAILGSRKAEVFSEDDVLMLRTVSSRATAIIVQAQLVAQERASRQQSEDARALLAAVVEQLPAGVIIGERQTGRVLLSNHQATEIFRQPLDGATSIEDYAICRGFHPGSGAPYAPSEWPLARTVTTGEVVSDEEIELLRGDGTRGWILVSSAPLRDPSGRVSAGVVTFIDITERTRAERAQRFLAAASAALSDSLDLEGALDRLARVVVPEIADWCVIQTLPDVETTRRLTVKHADPEEVRRARALFRELELLPGLNALAEQVLCGGRPELVRDLAHPLLASLSQQGALRRVVRELGVTSAVMVPLVARGRTFGCITLATAGSGRVYDEVDLALAHDLAQRAALAADNARVYEAAQRAIELRDNVLATVSHDLRNPLSAIITAAAVMTKRAASRGGDKGDTKAIQAIQRSAHRMDRLIHDLLDFASLRAGRLALQRQAQDPREIGREAVETFESLAQEKGVRLSATSGDDLPLVVCDRDRVLQVLSNLLSNALKVTGPQGSITVRCELREEHVVFAVADTGPGIPEDELPYLFERFWRGQRNGYKGTGLGLAIARELVAAHGGAISVESEVGVGTTFRFTIPVGSGEG
ncbi:sensor histidine kinase [Sorangium cellulosum]|uniref:histidine kinase n=1 Tax=Sorangium cellulosum TaxID=56 RepID=A0A2L0F2P1_SORCE|nr:ATP-binding protein [Sorangium cellulosum]AUX45848.1 sensor histidine kinase [Sorangium cellulosum]